MKRPDQESTPRGLVPFGPQHTHRLYFVPLIAGAEDKPEPKPEDKEGDEDKGDKPDAGADAGAKGGQEPQTFTRDYVEQLRRESAANRRKAAELESKVKEHETAQLSEAEKKDREIADLKAERDGLATERKTLLVRSEIERQARKLGVVDEDAAYRLLDLDALELDEDGKPKNVEALLKKLLEARPYLKGTTQETRAGVPVTPRANGQTNDQKIDESYKKLKATGSFRPL